MASDSKFDVAVVGAGPAGLAAGVAAASSGARVVVLDDNPDVGGQIWRRSMGAPPATPAARWRDRALGAGVEILTGASVVDAAPGRLTALDDAGLRAVGASSLVLATGARERFLPFPGWTLPGVMGAGGLQALAKSGWPIAGRRVVVAGSGPLLLAVADYLRAHGAEVVLLAEQAPWSRVAGFGVRLAGHPAKVAQAMGFGWRLRGVRKAYGCWPLRAEGDGALEGVVMSCRGRELPLDCDLLACGFGLIPNIEIAAYLGCALAAETVQVDEYQQSSVAGVFCAGELTGVGGVDLAIAEGRVAGHAAAGDLPAARRVAARRNRERSLAVALERAFALRADLQSLPSADTIVCRCEDVRYGQIEPFADARDAKLKTRCGMGSCQGRVCGPATRFLRGWSHDRVRPPFQPVPAEALARFAPSGTAET